MEDRQHGAVARRVEELVRVPARGQRPGLRLAVADDAGHDEVGVVERRAERVGQRVAELAALVDGARASRAPRGSGCRPGNENWRNSRRMPSRVAADARVDLAVGALEVRVGDDRRPAVARTDDVDRVQVVRPDHPVHVRVEQVQAGRRAPVAEQARLDVRGLERLAQQRVVEQVDLADGQVVGGAPPGVDPPQLVLVEGVRTALGGGGRSHRTGSRVAPIGRSDLAYASGDERLGPPPMGACAASADRG